MTNGLLPALVDTGASKSFISRRIVSTLHAKMRVSDVLPVRLPDREQLLTNEVVDLSWRKDNVIFKGSFYLLDMVEDAIIGADILERYHSVVDLASP